MQFKRTILPNGVRLITAPMPGNPTVTVLVNVATGSYYETPEEAGISHFLEHMCFKGTTKRPTPRIISTELDSIGAAYNAFTSTNMTGYYAKADVKHFEKIGDVISDIYLNSIFPEAEIEKEKGVVLGEIDMYADDPQQKIEDESWHFMYPGEPAGRDVLGTKETVKAITRDHLIEYRRSQYKGPNTVVTIAGGISEEEMISWAKKAFGGIEQGDVRPEIPTRDKPQSACETLVVEKDTDQAHIVMAWRTFPRSHPERHAARLVNGVLRGGMSSRLFIKLREEMGSGYYVGSRHSTERTFGRFSISTGTTAQRVAEIVGAVLHETERMKTELVPAGELDKVKELIRASMIMSLETSDAVADFLADQELLEDRIRTPEEIDAVLSALGPEDLKRAANLLFDDKKLTVAVIGKGIDKGALESVTAHRA